MKMNAISKYIILIIFVFHAFSGIGQNDNQPPAEKSIPLKGEGLSAFLRRNNLLTKEQIDLFMQLNSSRLGEKQMLKADMEYLIPSTIKEFYEQKEWNFSRIPVYDNNRDYIVGYILKDMVLKEVSDDKFQTRLSELVRPILSFNEDESLYQIWEKMLEKREHISIIVDEYGCLRGVVSMEDVIETMTGVEIVDEDDVAVDMQVLAKEKSRLMMKKKGA